MNGQCLHCGAPVRTLDVCKYCGTRVPATPAQPVSGPAICICGVLAATRCFVCDTAVCEPHTDRFWPGQSKTSPLDDPMERAVWDWAVHLDSASVAAFEGRDRPPRAFCTSCRASTADSAIERFRSLPDEDGRMRRQVAAAEAHFSGVVIDEPSVGLGPAIAAWMTDHKGSTVTVTTRYVQNPNATLRPIAIKSTMEAWVLNESPGYVWLIASDGALTLAEAQGLQKETLLVGEKSSRRGTRVEYRLVWKSPDATSTTRLATLLSKL